MSSRYMKFHFSIILAVVLAITGCSKVDLTASIEKTKSLLKERKLEEADKTITKCLPAAEKSPQILVLAALAKANKKDKSDFLAIIDQAQEAFKETEDSESLTLLGRACYEADELKLSVDFLEQSLELNPNDLYTVTLLISAEYKSFKSMRSYSKNNKYFQLAKKFESLRDSVQFYNLEAIILAVNPMFDVRTDRTQVEQKLMTAMLKDKKNPTTLLNLAVVYDIYFNKKRKAHGLYELYLEAVKLLPPDNTQVDKVQRRMTVLQTEI